MDGGQIRTEVSVFAHDLDRLMPMHLCLSASGHIASCGPTLLKLFPDLPFVGRRFFEVFDVRRPGGINSMSALNTRVGERIYLGLRDQPKPMFRGLAIPLSSGQGLVVNLSFGIDIVNAVRDHALTDADFAATDLAIELLYLVEAKSAVMEELRQLNLRLQGAKSAAEEQALTDTLTGLRNRRAQDLALEQVLGKATPFGLMHLDLDYFKAVNDTLGHAAGDHVLREVSRILSEETRSIDTVARVGGDEFVVILPELAEPARLRNIANRMIAKLQEPMLFEGQSCQISASIGMTISTFYPNPSADQMLSDADQALYACKRAGRGCSQMHVTSDVPHPVLEPDARG